MTVELLSGRQEDSIEYGLDSILSHFEKCIDDSTNKQFPWRIMTRLTGKQVQVDSREKAISMFKECNLLDCRISLYPFPVPEINDVNGQVPNFLLCDLDRKDFKSDKALLQCLYQTLENFKAKLHGASPTVLWSGGGYHILQPLAADIVLEEQNIFKEFIPTKIFENKFEPSRKFIQYTEMLMTNGMADHVHNDTMTFNNCLTRVPNSYNSKYIPKDDNGRVILTKPFPPQSRVRIEQLSNGYKPNIRYLLEGFWEHLIQLRNNDMSERLQSEQRRVKFEARHPYDVTPPRRQTWNNHLVNKMDWVERLIEFGLGDFRKYCITFIFVPYFINIRRLSDSDALNRIESWSEKCMSKQRLDFNARYKIRNDIKRLRTLQPRGCFMKPQTPLKIKSKVPDLYTLFQKEGIIL